MTASPKGTALVTGASSGIGAVYADRLAKRGYDLILVARNRDRLAQLAHRLKTETGRVVEIIAADLADKEDVAQVETLLRTDSRITLLVNNAGVGATAPLLDSDVDKMEAMIQLNVGALTRLTYAAAPSFVARGSGTIINIASIVAISPEILNGVYGGTKAFVLAFSQSLHHELGDKGVRIQAVLPGATATEFWDIAGLPIHQLPSAIVMSPEDLVDAALAGLDQGEVVTIPSLPDKAEWDRFDAAGRAMAGRLSSAVPAPRYNVVPAHNRKPPASGRRKEEKMMTPISMSDQWAKSRPKHVAFIARNEIWTYQRLATEADRVARGFLAGGVRPGDRVALHMANLPEMIVAYYACFRTGAIASPLNNRFKTSELKQVFQRLQPALYIGQAQLYSAVAAVDSTILPPTARYIVGGAVDDARAQPWASLVEDTTDISMPCVPDIDSPAVLLTTSGTTGQPKFVVHTPATLSAISDTCVDLGLQKDHVVGNCVPMVHASGLSVLLCSMRLGLQMILFERFDADAVLDGIEAYRCNWMVGLPFMYAALLKTQWTQPRKIDSVRCCLATGDVCPQQVQQEFPYAFGVPLRSFWAATETAGSLTFGLQLGPIARVVPGAEIRLVDGDGESVARGEVGELWVRGPNVTPGYWADLGRIEDPTFGGWFPTGDLMRQGEGDDLWFVSRKKDLIIRGGSNISPVEVERVLKNHPAVRDAAVFGVPDAVLGERVVGLVQLTENASPAAREDILAGAKAELADYKVPERLEIVSEIPRNGLGKIDRKLLRATMAFSKAEEIPVTF